MHSKAWIGIVAIGIVGLATLGFMTKFALDASPDLQKIISFKVAFAEEFKDSGIDDVTVKKRERGGYHLIISCPRDGVPRNSGEMDQRIALYFTEKFPDTAVRTLELSYVTSGSFGCSDPETIRRQEISLGSFRSRLANEEGRKKLFDRLSSEHGCALVREKSDGRTISIELRAPVLASEALRDLARRIEPLIREQYRVEPHSRLQLRLIPAGGAGEPTASGGVEVIFDARGGEITG